MELLGHDFFVFYNSDVDGINVLYRRRSGITACCSRNSPKLTRCSQAAPSAASPWDTPPKPRATESALRLNVNMC
jgi:hypothetical protein